MMFNCNHEQYFYQQKNMRQQLQRIKARDYSELDEKLYGNIAASSQLDTTISNLTQLQDYLKKMISRAENIEDKQTLLKASHVLYETQLHNKPSCTCLAHFQIILEQINKIKRYMKLSKDAIGREVRATVAHVSEDFHELAYFSNKEIQKAMKEVKIVRKQKEILEERVEQLMIQKEKLEKICNQWDEAKKRRRQRAESFRLIESEPVSSNQTPPSQKILTSQISSNHQLSVPQKPLRESTPPSYATGPIPTFRERNGEKQNYILRAKGVEMRQRQKSKKKIKLFSIL